jgi:hypothetical protein
VTEPNSICKSETGWMVYQQPAEVAPINDLRPHEIGKVECWCNPFMDGEVLVHNAMDKREEYEHGKPYQ